MFGAAPTKSGVAVNEKNAISLTAVWACINIIGKTLASFPLPVYKDLPNGGKEKDKTHRIYKLLHDQPNSEQSSYDWRLLTSIHQSLWGAGISEIEFDNRGNPIALWPIPPWCVEPVRIREDKRLAYRVTMPEGPQKILQPSQVLVFSFLPTQGGGWLSPIGVHRETLGSALAVKEFGARTFGNGINPAGILSGVNFGAEESERSLQDKYGGYEGLGNSHRLMLIEEGLKFERVGLPPEDAQYLETRLADVAEIARIFNVPLFMLQSHEKSTSWGTGLEEMKNGFISFTMRPYCIQYEQEFKRKLFVGDDTHFAEFLIDGLLRGNIKDRYAAYQIALDRGLFSLDEIREMENRNPIEDGMGKVRLIPMNMTTLQKVVKGDTADV